MSKIQNQDDYFDALQDSILKSIDKLYSNTQYTHHYVEGQIRSEEIIHETMGIFQNVGGGNIGSLAKVDYPKMYDFFDTIEFNLGVMTNNEITQFKKCFKILGEKIAEGGNIVGSDWFAKDENLAKLLGSKNKTHNEIRGLGGLSNGVSFFDFLNFFLNNYDERNESGNRKVLNLDELTKFVNNPDDDKGYPIAMGRFDEHNKDYLDDELSEKMKGV